MASIPRTLPRLPITPFLTKRTPLPTLRFNSTSTSSATSRIAQVGQMAAQAEKPTVLEASVPVMWALSGAAILAAWSRVDEKEDSVEKLLIV